MNERRKPTREELRTRLSSLQYHVTQEKGTERAFSGRYSAHAEPGTYYCICCGTELFESGKKFDAGCGWPSFWLPLAGERIHQHRDLSHGMARTEVTCAHCERPPRPCLRRWAETHWPALLHQFRIAGVPSAGRRAGSLMAALPALTP